MPCCFVPLLAEVLQGRGHASLPAWGAAPWVLAGGRGEHAVSWQEAASTLFTPNTPQTPEHPQHGVLTKVFFLWPPFTHCTTESVYPNCSGILGSAKFCELSLILHSRFTTKIS